MKTSGCAAFTEGGDVNNGAGKLRALLLSMLDGTPSYEDVTELVHLSRSAIQAYLFACQPAAAQLCSRHGLTLADLAYDCIAEVLARDGSGVYVHVQRFAGSLRGTLAEIPEHELFLAYKGFLAALAEAQLAKLYAYADPAGARIHRNIRLHLRNHPDLEIEKQFGVMVVRPRVMPSLDFCGRIPPEDLEKLFLARARTRQSIPELLVILYTIFAQQSAYRRSIPLLDMVRLFKTVYLNEAAGPEGECAGNECDGLSPSEIDDLREGVEAALKEKVFLTYVIRGKATVREGEALLAAMSDILLDWCDTGSMEKGLREYVHKHLPVEPSVFDEYYRTKMEYLLRIARAEMHARLMKSL